MRSCGGDAEEEVKEKVHEQREGSGLRRCWDAPAPGVGRGTLVLSGQTSPPSAVEVDGIR